MTEDNREPNPEVPAQPEPAGPAPTSHGADQASTADQPPSPDRPPAQPAADQPGHGSSASSGQPAASQSPQDDQPVFGSQPLVERSPFARPSDRPPFASRPPTGAVPYGDQSNFGSTAAGQSPTGAVPYGDQSNFGSTAAGQSPAGSASLGDQSNFGSTAAGYSPAASGPPGDEPNLGSTATGQSPAGSASSGDQPNVGSTTGHTPAASPGDQAGPPYSGSPYFGSQPPSAPGLRSPFAPPPADRPSHGDQSIFGSPYGDRPGGEPAAASTLSFGDRPPVDHAPAASFAASGGDTSPRAHTPQTGERVLFGTAFNQAGNQPPPGSYPSIAPPMRVGPNQPSREQRRGATSLAAGLTVLALLVGGGAGAVGGYIVAENNQSNGPVANALEQPRPAERTSTAPSGSVEAVAEKVLPSVVQLQVRGRSSAGEGSGFVISSDGLIVTNNHVVEAAAESGQIVAVFHDGSTASATIVGRDPTSDVAVVKADKTDLPVVDLGRSDDLRVGESVVAIGSPFELSGTVTSGIVSSLHRPTRAGGEDGSQATVMDAIQTDAAINPGNSGGPLVNMQGQVIGINSAIYSPTSGGQSQGGSVGIGFAIPIDQARRTADEIVKTGKATQTILGVTVRDGEQGGALIVEVTGNGPGAKAGLEKGDVVTKLDERKIDTSDALVAAVRSHRPGDKVRLELSNGSRTVEATLAGQPVETE